MLTPLNRLAQWAPPRVAQWAAQLEPQVAPSLEFLTEWAQVLRRAPGLLPGFSALRVYGLSGLLRLQAMRNPDEPALRSLHEGLSYAQADRLVDAWAGALRARGVRPGDCVAIGLPNRAELVLLPLALTRLGATSALLNPDLSGAALAHALRACRASALIFDAALVPQLETLPEPLRACCPEARAQTVAWALPPEGIEPSLTFEGVEIAGESPIMLRPRHGARPPPRPLPSELPLMYLFTSGTTGLPKAAPIHRGRLSLAALAFQSFAIPAGPGEVFFTPLPLFHASAWIVGLLPAWLGGAAFAFAPRFSASAYWQQCERVGATIGLYVGEMLRYLLAAGPRPPALARRLHTFTGNGLAAGPWRAALRDFCDAAGEPPQIVEFYGATEGSTLLINRNGKVGSCGRPVLFGPLDALRLVRYAPERDTHPRDAQGWLQLCGEDEPGELIARMGLLPSERFDGYLDEKATQKKILTGVFAPQDRWYRTGDLLRRDAAGDYFFVDRIGDTFRWKGENVSTQEVGELLRGALPEASHSFGPWVVYGVRVPGYEGRAGMVAAQLLGEPTAADRRALWQAAQALAPAARPVFVRLKHSLDTTQTLKWQRNRLQIEGYTDCGEEHVWLRDDTLGSYRPLEAADIEAIESGALRL